MKRLLLIGGILAVVGGGFFLGVSFWSSKDEGTKESLPETKSIVEVTPLPEEEVQPPLQQQEEVVEVFLKGELAVPYVNESPDGSWKGSWKNACEEATITMLEAYYKGEKTVSVEEAMAYMQMLFDRQKELYGSDVNSTAAVTQSLIASYAHFSATVVENPTITAIKTEIDAGHPVIAFHRGFDLHNPNIPFLATGSSYHATVIKGYDDAAQEFIVQDTGDTIDGADHRYTYDVYMNSLHDYQYATKLADGPPRVLFTHALETTNEIK